MLHLLPAGAAERLAMHLWANCLNASGLTGGADMAGLIPGPFFIFKAEAAICSSMPFYGLSSRPGNAEINLS